MSLNDIYLISVMNSPGGLWVWNTFGRLGLSPEFVAYMENLKNSDNTSFDLTAKGLKRGIS